MAKHGPLVIPDVGSGAQEEYASPVDRSHQLGANSFNRVNGAIRSQNQ